jgi:transcriptional regulator with XRE-family HTH domain
VTKTDRKAQELAVKRLLVCLGPSMHDRQMGQRLAERREELGLRLVQVAFEGCSTSTLSRLETGRQDTGLDFWALLELARRLRLEPVYLAWGRGPKLLDTNTEKVIEVLLQASDEDLETFQRQALQKLLRLAR